MQLHNIKELFWKEKLILAQSDFNFNLKIYIFGWLNNIEYRYEFPSKSSRNSEENASIFHIQSWETCALHCVETFLPDFIVILKRSLQNNYTIWKKCFFCTDSGEFVMKKLQDVVTKSLGSKG